MLSTSEQMETVSVPQQGSREIGYGKAASQETRSKSINVDMDLQDIMLGAKSKL